MRQLQDDQREYPVVVLLVDTLQTGGAEKSILAISRRFREHRPVVVVLFRGKTDLAGEFQAAGIEVLFLELPRSFFFRAHAVKVADAIRSLNPKLIHSTLFYSDMVARRMKPLLQVPLVNSLVNDTYGMRRYRMEPFLVKLRLLALHGMDALSVSFVDCFIANSRTIARTHINALRISPERVRVIYRGRDPEPFLTAGQHDRPKVRQKFGLTGKKIFLNIGRLIPRKGQAALIRSFASVATVRNDVMLWIAGEGPDRNALSDLISSLGLEDRIRMLGNRTDVPDLMRAADFFIFPSRFEGLPGVVIEAMLARLPLILSPIPENMECADASMALFMESLDEPSMSEKMLSALTDTGWADRTERAFHEAIKKFDPGKAAEDYEAVYRNLIAGQLLT